MSDAYQALIHAAALKQWRTIVNAHAAHMADLEAAERAMESLEADAKRTIYDRDPVSDTLGDPDE